MRTLLYLLFLIVLATASNARSTKQRPLVVLLGSYQMAQTDWTPLSGDVTVQNSSVSDFSSQQLSWTLKKGVLDFKPQYCILHTGLEDLLIGVPTARTLANISQMIDTLLNHHIKVILIGGFQYRYDSGINSQIKILNDGLSQIADRKKCIFKNLFNDVSTESTCLRLTQPSQYLWNYSLINILHEQNSSLEEITATNLSLLAQQRIERILKASPKVTKICMLGNSLTEGGKDWNTLTGGKYIRNCGQGGYTSAQMIWHMDTTVIQVKPTHCFIMDGINDLSLKVPLSVIFENYKTMIIKLQKSGITPVVQSTLMQVDGSENNPSVMQLNNLLISFCKDNNIDFIDVNRVLSDKNGLLKEYTSDGTHLVELGYKQWTRLLVGYLKQHKIQY